VEAVRARGADGQAEIDLRIRAYGGGHRLTIVASRDFLSF
jgi:hypothetical protein